MFNFWKRARAETAMKMQLDQLKSVLLHNCGNLSPSVWQDRYVMGYLYAFIACTLQSANSSSPREEYVALQLGRCWEYLTGRPPAQFTRDAFVLSDNRDVQFYKGMEAGTLCGLLMTGTANRDHPAVAELLDAARLRAPGYEATFGELSHHMTAAAGLAFMRDFFEHVQALNRILASN
jgi:hypothetical protein